MIVGRRRRLLSYIKKNDIVEYRELIAKLGIRDNIRKSYMQERFGALLFHMRPKSQLYTAGAMPARRSPYAMGRAEMKRKMTLVSKTFELYGKTYTLRIR